MLHERPNPREAFAGPFPRKPQISQQGPTSVGPLTAGPQAYPIFRRPEWRRSRNDKIAFRRRASSFWDFSPKR
jgi:hypothetical protein